MSKEKTSTEETTKVDAVAEVLQKEITSLEWDVKYHRDRYLTAKDRLGIITDALAKHLNS